MINYAEEFGIQQSDLDAYELLKKLPDGRLIGMQRLMFHWTIHVDLNWCGHSDKYCFATRELAAAALDAWDGTGDPEGWHRHLNSGRRRNIETGEEWIQF